MKERLRDYAHLVRFALLIAFLGVVFLLLRLWLVPDTFGDLGHYRAVAIEDNRAHPIRFAGEVACAECHGASVDEKSAGAHAGVRCEACHGATARHAQDPAVGAPARPTIPAVCLVCHRKNVARPAGFPQINPQDHFGETCGECHRPHAPKAG